MNTYAMISMLNCFIFTKTKEDKSYKNKKLIYLLEAFSEHQCNDKYVKLFYNYFK